MPEGPAPRCCHVRPGATVRLDARGGGNEGHGANHHAPLVVPLRVGIASRTARRRCSSARASPDRPSTRQLRFAGARARPSADDRTTGEGRPARDVLSGGHAPRTTSHGAARRKLSAPRESGRSVGGGWRRVVCRSSRPRVAPSALAPWLADTARLRRRARGRNVTLTRSRSRRRVVCR